ncbi:thymidylate kinase [Xylanibacillus composti]|uniref:Deoxynucleoside kinase n=1 Tax=Xylanibacillus composti TaxID=1572762 RepID=A0A8J4H0C9_9BACL|nr:deoxynucleoside kinase [Xylanibacillus composti]MDT9726792.1 thymidylate kinase [Xylanibacillus composti]GIQ67225.1 deoxynucleoside kinase [Xylanibacillus composti]
MKKDEYFLNKHNGVLIVVEGISGSGKSVGIRTLLNDLHGAGVPVVSYEWNAIPFLRKLTARIDRLGLLGTNMFSVLQWVGFLYDYFTIIRPHLKNRRVIVADRYFYTGLTRDAANGAWRWPGRFICRWLRQPDWLFYCETDAAVCYERIQQRGKPLFHKNKRILRDTSGRNKDFMYLELMHREYADMLKEIAKGTVNVVTIGKLPPSLSDSLVQYIYLKLGKTNVPELETACDERENDDELAEATGNFNEENHLSDRHVRGGTHSIKSMAD